MACVLIIDDEPETRYALAQVLEDKGHSVIETDGARAATEAIHRFNPDVLVCDLQLANGGALHLVEEVRRSGLDIPVIMIVGHGLARSCELVAAARRVRIAAVLQKPFDSETLFESIENAIGSMYPPRQAGTHSWHA